jgi:AraC-like DNA-binding protein
MCYNLFEVIKLDYRSTRLKEEFNINNIITIHYFEHTKDFIFTGESHDFWEFVYVDKGEIIVTADDKSFKLCQGDVVFHKPNEFHNLASNGIVAPNIVIISFECNSRAMNFFNNRIFTVVKEQKYFLSQIIKEATNTYITPMGDPFTKKLVKSKEIYFASEQIIKLCLIQFLISLCRNNLVCQNEKTPPSIIKERLDDDITDDIIDFLNKNIGQRLVFDDIIKLTNMSRTNLKKVFKEKIGMGVMAYFNKLKIEQAKIFIRENNYNFSQIGTILGYDTIHYFSKQFKKLTNMTPSEYAKSVKVYYDKNE